VFSGHYVRVLGKGACILVLMAGGCAGIPLLPSSQSSQPLTNAQALTNAPSIERKLLSDAVRAVEATPWPATQKVSFSARITGAKNDDRITRSDAIEIYLDTLLSQGARFAQLTSDARANLNTADTLLAKANNVRFAQRLSMSDVAIIEGAIQKLRENGKIYAAAAKALEKSGARVDQAQLADIRAGYRAAIKALGASADAVAGEISRRQDAYAASRGAP